MNRRRVLATLGTLALGTSAGCAATSQTNTSSDAHRTVSVSHVGRTTPEDVETVTADERPTGLRFDVAVTDATVSPDSTARVELTYANAGQETLELNVNPEHPGPVTSVETDPGLLLLSGGYDPTRASDACWKPTQDHFGELAVAYQHPIEPGESATLAYDVWAAPSQEATCIAPGAYHFETLYGAFTLHVT